MTYFNSWFDGQTMFYAALVAAVLSVTVEIVNRHRPDIIASPFRHLVVLIMEFLPFGTAYNSVAPLDLSSKQAQALKVSEAALNRKTLKFYVFLILFIGITVYCCYLAFASTDAQQKGWASHEISFALGFICKELAKL